MLQQISNGCGRFITKENKMSKQEIDFDEELRQDLKEFHTKMNNLYQDLSNRIEKNPRTKKEVLITTKGGKTA